MSIMYDNKMYDGITSDFGVTSDINHYLSDHKVIIYKPAGYDHD